MKKRLVTLLLVMASMIGLCGCGNAFRKEYVSVTDYVMPKTVSESEGGKVTVKNLAALKQAILDLAYAGKENGVVVFNQDYEGDPVEDLAAACWQVRTQDALCAYCVENIAYELNKIVTVDEAKIYISYSQYADKPQDIVFLSFSYAMESILKKTLEDGNRHRVLLVNKSAYDDADQVEALITNIYHANPTIVPKKPFVTVNVFSGTGTQQLYEVNINYTLSDEELALRREKLAAVDPFEGINISAMNDEQKAITAADYLISTVTLVDDSQYNNAYSALVEHTANSEGIALAYVELCHRLGLDAQIVYGQRNWSDHCWAMVKVNGDHYHVDLDAAIQAGPETSVLCSDEQFWGNYRWDVASYPKCTGTLTYPKVTSDADEPDEAEKNNR